MKKLSRRALIRLGSYLAALVVVLGVGAGVGYNRARTYKRQLEYTYMRSLDELSGYVTDISNTLNKGIYAGTPAQLSTLSSKLWKEAGSAKAALSSLPITELDLTTTYKFLSQVGDYAMDLSKKVGAGQTLSAEEEKNLTSLLSYAQQLSDHIEGIGHRVSSGDIQMDDVVNATRRNSQNGAEDQQSPDDNKEGDGSENPDLIGFEEMEDSMEGYPTLIYDGPFSDHLLERQPLLIQDKASVSQEQALQKAAQSAGLEPTALVFSGEENSVMPSYCFSGADVSVAVTKQAGYLAYLTNSRQIGERTLSNQDAIAKANEYLDYLGLSSMEQNYFEIANGVCTVNFAYAQGGVTCYPDLIKVGVAMDNGQVVFVDARPYITNHHNRNIPSPAISSDEALASVSKKLQPEKAGLAIIPSSGMNEVFAYEFRCKSAEGQNVLVYVNAATGAEEQILILIESEEGVLTV